MADRYAQLVGSPVGRRLARPLGLPRPAPLGRHEPGAPVIDGRVLLGAAPGGRLAQAAVGVLYDAGVATVSGAGHAAYQRAVARGP